MRSSSVLQDLVEAEIHHSTFVLSFPLVLLLHKQETSVTIPAGHPLSLSNHHQSWALGFGLQVCLSLLQYFLWILHTQCRLQASGGGDMLTSSSLSQRKEERAHSRKLGGRALGEVSWWTHSLCRRGAGFGEGLCVCVCVAIVGLSCLLQAFCQVRDEYSWLSCWAHLYNYTFVQKACFSNAMKSPLGLWLRLCVKGERRALRL